MTEIERLQDAKRRALAIADERAKENVQLLAERDALVKALEDIDKHLDNFGYLPNMKARKLARVALNAVSVGKQP